MAEVLDRPRGVELLRYRPWHGELAGSGAAGVLGFLAVQAALLAVLAAIPGYPAVRLALSVAFIGLWGMVVYSRGWPIARVSLALLLKRWLFWIVFGLAMLVF